MFLKNMHQIYKDYKDQHSNTVFVVRYKPLDDAFVAAALSSVYISEKVLDKQKLKSCMAHVVTCTFDKTILTISVLDPSGGIPPLRKIMDVLKMYVFMLNRLLKRVTNVYMCIVLNKAKKEFEHDKYSSKEGTHPLGPTNINSGFKSSGRGLDMIFIYRKEELTKVMLHELLHYYEADHYDTKLTKYKNIGKYRLISSHHTCLNESYIEFLTTLMYTYLHLIENNRKLTNFNDLYTAYVKSLSHRILYILRVAGTILSYYGAEPIHEESHLFSYYIAKAALLVNMQDMFKFMSANNINGGLSLDPAKQGVFETQVVPAALDSKRFQMALKTHVKKTQRAKGKSLCMIDIRL